MIRRAALAGFLAVLMAIAPAAGGFTREVVIEDTSTGFQPASTSVGLGQSVHWTNEDNAGHTATGDAPLSLWDRALPVGGDATRRFRQVGRFAYHCKIHPSMTGAIRVPMFIGGGAFEVGSPIDFFVRTGDAPSGFRYRIQRRRPGDSWATWRTVTATKTTWTPGSAAAGDWQFRARTERVSDGATSGWSQVAKLTIVP